MCRYSDGGYRGIYVCFSCRVAWKDHRFSPASGHGPVVCSKCKGEAAYMGRDFKAPRQTQVGQWKKVELIFQRKGERCFDSCGCGRSGGTSKTLADEKAKVARAGRTRTYKHQEIVVQ